MLRALVYFAAVVLTVQGRSGDPITVSAAVSLTEAMQEIGTAFETSTGQRVIFNFGGSNVLARQIVNGAPVDVFISADTAQMDLVERARLAVVGSRAAITSNRLAIVVRRDRASPPTSAAALADASVRRIAIGDPEAVPAGVYARQYLERVGVWERLQRKLLPSANVRAALAAVENGSADAGIVYVTDVRAARELTVSLTISGPDAPRIAYPACVVASSRRAEAASRFLQFLQAPAAAEIFRRHGFQPLNSAAEHQGTGALMAGTP
jgi:molybdate transport system substrate-binding protein